MTPDKHIEFNIPPGETNLDHKTSLTPHRLNKERLEHPLRNLSYFDILNPDFKKQGAFNNIDIVVIGGSSGVGKTEIFTKTRKLLEYNPEFRGFILFPVRDVNRPSRESDKVFEESRVASEDLLDPDTEYSVRWLRELNDEITYLYGFKEIGHHNLVVLSGNNALLEHLANNPELMLDSKGNRRVVRIGIYTDEETRAKRFLKRSGHEIKQSEIDARLKDPTERAKDARLVDLVLDNSLDEKDQGPSNEESQMRKFLMRLAGRRDEFLESYHDIANYY